MKLIDLKRKANDIRKQAVTLVYNAQTGHIGGSLSCIDYLTVLYYAKMNFKVSSPEWENRDRFILSKGHCIEGYLSILADLGYIPISELDTFCQFGTRLIGHPDRTIPGIEMNTGSLGHGLGGACGMALAGKRSHAPYRIYVLLGDGELCEGSIWEAFLFANHYQLDNLYVAIDRNHLQISGPTEDIMQLEPLEDKLKTFGFAVTSINGNEISEILDAFENLEKIVNKPKMIILNTTKGKGISYMENQPKWHHGRLNKLQYQEALSDLNKIEKELIK